VAEVYPELVARNRDGEVESVMYQFLPPMLLNEAQKQHGETAKLRATISTQQTKIDQLTTALQAMNERLSALEHQGERR
jgi:hypothetical protein